MITLSPAHPNNAAVAIMCVSTEFWRKKSAEIAVSSLGQIRIEKFRERHDSYTTSFAMDEYDYDSASQYGVGLDDTASMISGYTARTQKTTGTGLHLENEFDSLSVIDNNDPLSANGKAVDDDFDGVLDDVKDDTAADLPPHACRYTLC